MLTDIQEIEIVSRARQKNVRDPRRSRGPFENIFADFLAGRDLKGQRLLDLGPGQYDFGVLARDRGAEVVGLDNDPAVVALGRHKGFEVQQGHIQDIRFEDFVGGFDGLFCKFSINAFWFWNSAAEQASFIERLAGLLRPDGWSWVAPWNGMPKSQSLTPKQVEKTLSLQAALFHGHGFWVGALTRAQAVRYGVTGAVANHALFTRNLLPLPLPAGNEEVTASAEIGP